MQTRNWAPIVLVLALAICRSLAAAPAGPSIAINFGANQPDGLGNVRADVEGPAGVLRTATWNNMDENVGGPEPLSIDTGGTASPSTATVSWISNNLWSSSGRGEENNDADEGNDRNLMAGYLDTTSTSITEIDIQDLDSVFTANGYDVYVYIKGGINNRGGTYTLTGGNFMEEQFNVQTGPFDGEYILGEEGNYLLYSGLTAADFLLQAQATDTALFRAPVNGIEIVAAASGTLLQAGDADQDLDFDQLDLVRVQIAGKYLTGQAASWGEGDWNGAPGGSQGNPPPGNNRFDQLDIIAALGANTYLRGPYAAVRRGGTAGDGQTSITYNPATGELGVDAPAGTNLTSVNIDSAARIFTGAPAQNLGGSFDNDSDNNIFKATFGSSFGSLSFGAVAQPGLAESFVLGDLTVVGSLAGGGALGDVDLIYIPEPSTVALLAIGVIAMAARRWKE
jgi:hypothetical protein